MKKKLIYILIVLFVLITNNRVNAAFPSSLSGLLNPSYCNGGACYTGPSNDQNTYKVATYSPGTLSKLGITTSNAFVGSGTVDGKSVDVLTILCTNHRKATNITIGSVSSCSKITSTSTDGYWSDAVKAGVASIYRNVLASTAQTTPKGFIQNDPKDSKGCSIYYNAIKTVSKFQADKSVKGVSSVSDCVNNTWLTAANKEYDNVKNMGITITSVETKGDSTAFYIKVNTSTTGGSSSKTFKFYDSSNNEVPATLEGSGTYSGYHKILKSKFSGSTIKVRVTSYYNTYSVENYYCSNYQQLSPIYYESKQFTKSAEKTITLQYTNGISHWMSGFKNSEGNNSSKNSLKIGYTTFTAKYNSAFTMDNSRAVDMPNGFYLGGFGSSHVSNDGSWGSYKFPLNVTQKNFGMSFEYYYIPITYKITYELNGGTNNSANPSTYNVLYGVTLKNPTKTGYTFAGWYIGDTKVTGINSGANATFSSVSDMYSKLKSRTTGDKTIEAKWTPITYTNGINHWMSGFKNGEGNNSSKNSFKIGYTTFTSNYNSKFTMDSSRAVNIPNGFYLGGFGSSHISDDGSWKSYTKFPQSVTQKNFGMSFEYYYNPITYKITYKLNGGTNNSANPSTYNVLYGVTLQNPTKVGYTFNGWYGDLLDVDESLVFKNETAGNRLNSFKIQLYTASGDYLFNILSTSSKGNMTHKYKHQSSSGYYRIVFGANGTKKDYKKTYNVYLEQGKEYDFSWNQNFVSDQEIKISNFKLKGIVSGINVGANATFSSPTDMYNKLAPRTIGDKTLEARWNPNILTVNYHSNGADKSFKNPSNAVSKGKDVIVQTVNYPYDKIYENGVTLQDYSYQKAYCYLARTGFVASGDWNTKIDRTGITLNENERFTTSQEFALALGVDIRYGNATVDVYPQWLIPFEINKVNTSGASITSSVYFSIYNNENDCIANRNPYMTNVMTQNGKTTNFALFPGNYYIKETKVEDTTHYYVDNTCHPISVGEGKQNKITVENKTKCERDFKDDIYSRINLFKQYPTLNNLLNFRIRDAKTACSGQEPEYENIGQCMYTEQNFVDYNDFNSYNLSDFNDVIQQNSQDIGYCITSFETNGIDNSYLTEPIKAGTLIVGANDEYDPALTARLTKTCYVYNKDIQFKYKDGVQGIEDQKTYSNYIEAIVVKGESLWINGTDGSDIDSPIFMKYEGEEDGLSKFVGEVSVDYLFPPVYAEKISGRLCPSESGHELPMCHSIGFGIISEFQDGKKTKDDSNGNTYLRSFDVNFNFAAIKNPNSRAKNQYVFLDINQSCDYEVEPEIIKYNDVDKGKIDIEFRAIDTNKPFNRTPKSNWNDGSNKNNSGNGLISDYIINATNSHGIKKGDTEVQTPKYKITLTSNIINEIKEYNDNNSYDDYEMCEGNCESRNAFINEYIKKGIIQKEN